MDFMGTYVNRYVVVQYIVSIDMFVYDVNYLYEHSINYADSWNSPIFTSLMVIVVLRDNIQHN